MNVRRKLVAVVAGLLLAGLAFGAGATSTGKSAPAQMQPTTTTTGY